MGQGISISIQNGHFMEITHNNLNGAIDSMNLIVAKGQPFAKRNKDRRIRSTLRQMGAEQAKPITFKEVWFYFRLWIKGKCLNT